MHGKLKNVDLPPSQLPTKNVNDKKISVISKTKKESCNDALIFFENDDLDKFLSTTNLLLKLVFNKKPLTSSCHIRLYKIDNCSIESKIDTQRILIKLNLFKTHGINIVRPNKIKGIKVINIDDIFGKNCLGKVDINIALKKLATILIIHKTKILLN